MLTYAIVGTIFCAPLSLPRLPRLQILRHALSKALSAFVLTQGPHGWTIDHRTHGRSQVCSLSARRAHHIIDVALAMTRMSSTTLSHYHALGTKLLAVPAPVPARAHLRGRTRKAS
jgi:hypothetical protein